MQNIREFLGISGNTPQELNMSFQKQLEDYYVATVRPKIVAMTERSVQDITNVITRISRFSDQGNTISYARYLPKYQEQYRFPGMECTLASAMLKLALQEKGYSGVCTLLTRGHQVTGVMDTSGSIEICDPSTAITKDGRLTGFYYHFVAEYVTHNKLQLPLIKSVTIKSPSQIQNTGLFPFNEQTNTYQNTFYELPEAVHVHLTTVLRNLREYFLVKDEEFANRCKQLCDDFGNDNPHLLIE